VAQEYEQLKFKLAQQYTYDANNILIAKGDFVNKF